jgi:two-component system NtrC family sensor kinase
MARNHEKQKPFARNSAYQVLFENNPQPMLIYDEESLAFLAVNDAALQKYGFSQDEFLQMTIKDIRPAEDIAALLHSISLRAEGRERVGTWRHRKKDGSLFQAEITIHRMEWQGRKARLALITDVTEGRRTAAALSESEEQIRLLLDSAAEGVFGVDLKGVCTFSNHACVSMLGFSQAGELLGKDMHRLCHHSRADGTPLPIRESKMYQAFRHDRGAHASDEVFWRRDGTPFPTEYWSYPIRRGGVLTGYVVSFVDITERRQAEKNLESRTAYLNALIENNPLATVVLDSDYVVQMCNPAFAKLFLYDRTEVVGRLLDELVVPPAQPALLRKFSEANLNGEVLHAITRRARKDGSLVDVEVYGVPLVIDGQVRGSYGIYRDISEEKRLEQQLRQAQKMEAVGRLAGGVAHDFNNLLSVIIGYSELLEGAVEPKGPLGKNVGEIKKAARRAASLTRQLLAFSRKQVLEPKVLNLNSVVSETDKMLQRLLGEDIEIVTRLDPALGQVKVDQGQIEQVIMNLLVNARDAMPQGGRLTIETSNVDLDEAFAQQHPPAKPGRYVRLTVSDSGTGMDAETQAHIFEPFFTTKEFGRGTGLGLATVYGVVKQSEGYIWVSSELGHGATFQIHLPRVALAAEQTAPSPEAAPGARGTETILLVEDEDALRELARVLLEDAGYLVLEANNGARALEIAGRTNGVIDLLLADVVMPAMSGPTLAEKLSPLKPEMKVLFMSGYPDDKIVNHGVLAEGTVLLQKPFSRDSLLSKVRELLNSTGGRAKHVTA